MLRNVVGTVLLVTLHVHAAITCSLPAAPEQWNPQWRGEGARGGRSEARWALAATAGLVLRSLPAVRGAREIACNDLCFN